MAVALLDVASCAPSLPQLEEARGLFSNAERSLDDAAEIRRVYLRLALLYHPDKRAEAERQAATQLFQAIAAVYEELLNAADPEAKVQRNRVKSPAAAAAELGDLVELRRLLEAQPWLANEVDDLGVYVLMFAASGGSVAAAELLLKFGADLHAKNPINWSVLLYAALGNHAPMVDFLVEQGAEVTSHELILAAYTGNPKSLESLLKHYRGSVQELRTDTSKKTLLHLACEGMCFLRHTSERHAECVRLILQYKVPVDAVDPTHGRTCLQDFVGDVRWRTRSFEDSAAHMAVLDELCASGADVTAEDAEGHSALSIATGAQLMRARELLFSYR